MNETVLNAAPCTQWEDKSMQNASAVFQKESGLEECVLSTIELYHFQYTYSIHFWCFMNNL